MSATATVTIPFEGQSDPQTRRDCGAACLSMIYRSLGRQVLRDEIWRAIAKENRFGSLSSTTHLMAKDAIVRGFAAVAIQARHPLQALRVCRDAGVRVILNLRLSSDTRAGHYTVLADIESSDVALHDPLYGPYRRVPHAELLELWQSGMPNSEIVGYVLIAIAAEPAVLDSCWLCHAPMPSRVDCPKCKQPVRLQPNAILGCMNSDCVARMWNYVCCPSCDYAFTFSLDPPALGAVAPRVSSEPAGAGGSSSLSPDRTSPPAPGEDFLDLSKVFAEVEKFCSHILTIPGAADHPDIKKQLNFIASSKEKLKLAQAEALVHRKLHQEQLAQMLQTAKQNEEAQRQKLEELNGPLPPLDGDALAQALLKNLGFIK